MNKADTPTHQIVYIPGDRIDREKWDRCIANAVNGNICGYSWFMDIMCSGWGGLVEDDYEYIMPLPVARRFGISYLLQPRFIQQSGVFGALQPDIETIGRFLEALPGEISVVDYHFNDQNSLPSAWDVEMRTNLLLKTDRPYEELRHTYSQNLIRNLKKSSYSGFHFTKSHDPEPLIKLFREENRKKFSFLKEENFRRLTGVIHACLHRDKAEVWTIYSKEKELCGGIIWLYSHNRALFYFSAQSKAGREGGALAWLIDAFIRENSSSGTILDFEGSVHPGLTRFYGSFGPVIQSYSRLKINHLSPFFKLVYLLYRKMKKD